MVKSNEVGSRQKDNLQGDSHKVEIYTDGACSGNPGYGGWGAVLIYKGREKEISGSEANTTNQRMELRACIEALSAIKKDVSIFVYTDSAYLANCFKQEWYKKWMQNGWRNSHGQPVANQDLWEKLIELALQYRVEFVKIKGHSGIKFNERADKLARNEIRGDEL